MIYLHGGSIAEVVTDVWLMLGRMAGSDKTQLITTQLQQIITAEHYSHPLI